MQQAQLPTAQKQTIPSHVSQLAAVYYVSAVVNEYKSKEESVWKTIPEGSHS